MQDSAQGVRSYQSDRNPYTARHCHDSRWASKFDLERFSRPHSPDSGHFFAIGKREHTSAGAGAVGTPVAHGLAPSKSRVGKETHGATACSIKRRSAEASSGGVHGNAGAVPDGGSSTPIVGPRRSVVWRAARSSCRCKVPVSHAEWRIHAGRNGDTREGHAGTSEENIRGVRTLQLAVWKHPARSAGP